MSEEIRDYAVLDIENPNVRGNSICAISVLKVEGGKVAGSKFTLIDPEDSISDILFAGAS